MSGISGHSLDTNDPSLDTDDPGLDPSYLGHSPRRPLPSTSLDHADLLTPLKILDLSDDDEPSHSDQCASSLEAGKVEKIIDRSKGETEPNDLNRGGTTDLILTDTDTPGPVIAGPEVLMTPPTPLTGFTLSPDIPLRPRHNLSSPLVIREDQILPNIADLKIEDDQLKTQFKLSQVQTSSDAVIANPAEAVAATSVEAVAVSPAQPVGGSAVSASAAVAADSPQPSAAPPLRAATPGKKKKATRVVASRFMEEKSKPSSSASLSRSTSLSKSASNGRASPAPAAAAAAAARPLKTSAAGIASSGKVRAGASAAASTSSSNLNSKRTPKTPSKPTSSTTPSTGSKSKEDVAGSSAAFPPSPKLSKPSMPRPRKLNERASPQPSSSVRRDPSHSSKPVKTAAATAPAATAAPAVAAVRAPTSTARATTPNENDAPGSEEADGTITDYDKYLFAMIEQRNARQMLVELQDKRENLRADACAQITTVSMALVELVREMTVMETADFTNNCQKAAAGLASSLNRDVLMPTVENLDPLKTRLKSLETALENRGHILRTDGTVSLPLTDDWIGQTAFVKELTDAMRSNVDVFTAIAKHLPKNKRNSVEKTARVLRSFEESVGATSQQMAGCTKTLKRTLEILIEFLYENAFRPEV